MVYYRWVVFYLADPTLARHLLATVWVVGSFEFAFKGLEYIGIGIGIPRNLSTIKSILFLYHST